MHANGPALSVGRTLVLSAALAACATTGSNPAIEPAPATAPIQNVVDLPPPTAEDGYFEVSELLRPGVLLIRQAEPFHVWPSSNIVVFEQSNGLVVVDTGNAPAAAERVLPLIRAFSAKPVTTIVITHEHYDHTGGLQVFLREWPAAQVIATQRTREAIAGRAGFWYTYDGEHEVETQQRWLDNAREQLVDAQDGDDPPRRLEGLMQAAREAYQYARDRTASRRVVPTIGFNDRYVIADSEAPIELLFLGNANTPGDAVIWSPRHRVIAAGDIVVSPVPYGFNIYANDMIDTVSRIRAYDFDILVPGHGLPQHDRQYLDLLIRSIEDAKAKMAPFAGQADFDLPRMREYVNANMENQVEWFGVGDDVWLREYLFGYWLRPVSRALLEEARGVPNRYENDLRTPEQRAAMERDMPPAPPAVTE